MKLGLYSKFCLNSQSGVTLAVTLLLLLMVTVLGVSAVRLSLVEEKMSGNMRDKHIAFEGAESALRVAEGWLDQRLDYPTPTSTGVNHVWNFNVLGSNNWWKVNSVSWWADKSVAAPMNTMQKSAPLYFIEERAFVQRGENLSIGSGEKKQGKYYYQVTSRGHGGTDSTRVHLRTTFIKRFD